MHAQFWYSYKETGMVVASEVYNRNPYQLKTNLSAANMTNEVLEDATH